MGTGSAIGVLFELVGLGSAIVLIIDRVEVLVEVEAEGQLCQIVLIVVRFEVVVVVDVDG